MAKIGVIGISRGIGRVEGGKMAIEGMKSRIERVKRKGKG